MIFFDSAKLGRCADGELGAWAAHRPRDLAHNHVDSAVGANNTKVTRPKIWNIKRVQSANTLWRVAEILFSQVTKRGNADYRFFVFFRFFAAAAAARPPPSPPFSAMRFESAFSRGFRRFRRAQPQIEPLSTMTSQSRTKGCSSRSSACVEINQCVGCAR